MNPHAPFEDDVLATILLDTGSGRPIVRPPVIRIKRGGSVHWRCDEGRWQVELKPYDAGPFSDRTRREVSGAAGKEAGETIHQDAHTGGERRTDPGAPTGAMGRYRYSVTVWVDGERHHDDPDMVVGPEQSS